MSTDPLQRVLGGVRKLAQTGLCSFTVGAGRKVVLMCVKRTQNRLSLVPYPASGEKPSGHRVRGSRDWLNAAIVSATAERAMRS